MNLSRGAVLTEVFEGPKILGPFVFCSHLAAPALLIYSRLPSGDR